MKLGVNSVPFIQKALSYYQNYPILRVDYVVLAEWENDLAVMRRLQSLQILVDFLYEAVEDTVVALKKKNMDSALVFYNNVKKAATTNVPGTSTIFEDMQQHFPGLKVNRKKRDKDTK